MLRQKNRAEGGRRICGINRVGVLASQIPTGFDPPAFLLNDIDAAFPSRLYRVQILTGPTPAGAALYLFEDSSGIISGTDGSYSGTQRVSKYDPGVGIVSAEEGPYTFTIGNAVAAEFSASYMVLGAVSADFVASFDLLASSDEISADWTSTYAISEAVTADLGVVYSVVSYISAERAFIYSVLSETTFARAPTGDGYRPRSQVRQSRPRDIQGNYR